MMARIREEYDRSERNENVQKAAREHHDTTLERYR
jgi:hypothetical protein